MARDCIEEWKISLEELRLLINQYIDNPDHSQNSKSIPVSSLSIDRMEPFSSSPSPLFIATSRSTKRPVSAQLSSSTYKSTQDVSFPRLSSPPPPGTSPSPVLKPSALSAATATNNNNNEEEERSTDDDGHINNNTINKDDDNNNNNNHNNDLNSTDEKSSSKQPHLFSLDTTTVHSFIDLFYKGGHRLIRMVESSFLEKFGLHVSNE